MLNGEGIALVTDDPVLVAQFSTIYVAPSEYFTRAGTGKGRNVIIHIERAPYLIRMFEMSAEGKGGRFLRQWLEDNKIKKRGDKLIRLSMIYRMLGSTF
jgi:hypothetical protein